MQYVSCDSKYFGSVSWAARLQSNGGLRPIRAKFNDSTVNFKWIFFFFILDHKFLPKISFKMTYFNVKLHFMRIILVHFFLIIIKTWQRIPRSILEIVF